MLSRTIRFMCSGSASRPMELLQRIKLVQEGMKSDAEVLKKLQKQMGDEDKKLEVRNKKVHEMRVQLTNDVRKGDEIWGSTKKKAQANKKESIQNFAKGLVELGQNLIQIKALQREEHDPDMTEGFDLTSRLFFSTLEKYRIVKFEPEAGQKFNKDTMQAEREETTEKKEQKETIVEMLESGWEAEGMVIKKAKVAVYK